MRVIPPITISSITSSTIAEPDTGETAWVSAGSYTIGDRRIRTTTHKIYEALSTHTGRTALPEVDTVYWFEVGPTNKWAMFDLYRSTTSVIPGGGFSVVLTLNSRVNSMVLTGVTTPNITVTVTSVTGGGTVFGPTTYTGQLNTFVKNIPAFKDAIITISSTGAGEVSAIVLGYSEYLGYTLKGHTNDALNFSTITRDTYGNSTITQRRSVPKTSQNLVVRKRDLATVLKIRSTLNATPAAWIGLDDSTEGYFNSLLIIGIYKNISLTINNPEFIDCTLELEEL